MKKISFYLLLLLISSKAIAQKSVVLEAFGRHQINENILDPKIKQRPEDVAFDYKYTSVANDKEKVTIAKYDPSKAPDERWTVISVNGQGPSAGDIKSFRKDHSQVFNSAGKIDESSMKVEKETADELIVSYKVDAGSLPKASAFLKDCRNHLTINLKTKRLEKLQCLNEIPVKIKILKVQKLDLVIKYAYNEEQQRYLPMSEDLNLIVKFLGQEAPMETISEYSNFSKK